jgi:hypothetical protein
MIIRKLKLKPYNSKQEKQRHTNEFWWNLTKVVFSIYYVRRKYLSTLRTNVFENENLKKVSSKWDQLTLCNKTIITWFFWNILLIKLHKKGAHKMFKHAMQCHIYCPPRKMHQALNKRNELNVALSSTHLQYNAQQEKGWKHGEVRSKVVFLNW